MPASPTDVAISEVAATSVRLEWSYKGPEDLQYYVIQYKPKNANQVICLFYFFLSNEYSKFNFISTNNKIGI